MTSKRRWRAKAEGVTEGELDEVEVGECEVEAAMATATVRLTTKPEVEGNGEADSVTESLMKWEWASEHGL